MAFDLGRFFKAIFHPQPGEEVVVMHDYPHGAIADHAAWQDRRLMATEWHAGLKALEQELGIRVQPLVTYAATGGNNADLPALCRQGDLERPIVEVVQGATIVIAMTQYSPTAPLYAYARASKVLRVASMPGVARFMENSGLAADYDRVYSRCARLVPIFDAAVGARAIFSTGHSCYFDIPGRSEPDDGLLYPERAGTEGSLQNLPAGEVYTVPNEGEASKTEGELPFSFDGVLAVFEVKQNRIQAIRGDSPRIAALREKFMADPAWCNIAEFAIGVNESARVTGVVLEDEKAGFHWAYGRSDHLGGTIGVKDFKSPANVVHQDMVYAKGCPVECASLEFFFPDGTSRQLIKNCELLLED